MAIDIRATVTCSLGTLISGSISDDYIQGSGLVKTKGSIELSALITPAIGTVVTFSYVKGGVTRSIPRKLRVMSSFADPFRRTTKVELGCKLTYLSDLQEPVDWTAFDDPENAAYDADDARIVTLPLYASSVMNKCLTELGITANSNPLTNKFSIAEFDFDAGYVSVLSDLLVSESYCGYLDTNEVLQVFNLDQDAGTGPVFTASDIVDLGPIGVGALPGEAVTVSFSTLKLKQPEDNTDDVFGDNNASRLWERSVTTAGPNFYYVGAKVFSGIESTETLTIYTRVDNSDVPIKRVTTETGSSAKIAGSIGSAYETNGIGFNAITTTLRREEELNTYDKDGNRIRSEVTQYEQALAVFGGVSLEYVFSPTDFVNFSYVLLPSARRVSTYNIVGDLQQETSSTYVLWPQTLTGQQAVAEYRDSLDNSAAVSSYVNAIASAGLVHERTAVTINTVGTEPGRPLDILNAAYSKDGDPNNGWRTESKADLELAVGSATAQRRIEFSLPYAPDDTFSGPTGGPFTAVASDAPAKANRYGRVQNRLLLGNRNGINLQLVPEKLPAAPYSPLYVQASGLTALYRANGTSWVFDSNGIVASVDALFWSAVGGTGTFWFPVAPGITTLPTTPAIVDGTMTPTTVVLPYNETAIYNGILRTRLNVTKFDYSLTLLTEVDPLVTTISLNVKAQRTINVPASNIQLAYETPVYENPYSEILSAVPVLYQGNGSTQSISALPWSPGMVWIKGLNGGTLGHVLTDAARGANVYWLPNASSAETTDSQHVSSFDAKGFTVGNASRTNGNGTNYISWSFPPVSPASANVLGTTASTVCVGDFYSVALYAGASTDRTFGHGLNGAPELVIIKARNSFSYAGVAGGSVLGTNKFLTLNQSDTAFTDSSKIKSADSTTVSLGSDGAVNNSGINYVAYCFRSLPKACKVGTYTGDGDVGGQLVDCGFEVKFLIVKSTTTSEIGWLLIDSARGQGNEKLNTSSSAQTLSSAPFYELTSSGFRALRGDQTSFDDLNASSTQYMYIAFASVTPTVLSPSLDVVINALAATVTVN